MNSSKNAEPLNIVITGGTGQLGTATTAAFLASGAQVYIPVFGPAAGNKEIERFEYAAHERVHLSPDINLTDEDHVVKYYASLPGLWASIHIAGGFAMAPLAETSKADFQRQMDLNALSAFLCCREAANNMGKNGGRIVNVAARPALEPRTGAGMVAYSASKAAVAAMSQALGEELAPKGILVNAIAPSILDTPPNREAMPDADFNAWPKVDEVAATIAFLASPDNKVTRSSLVTVYGKS